MMDGQLGLGILNDEELALFDIDKEDDQDDGPLDLGAALAQLHTPTNVADGSGWVQTSPRGDESGPTPQYDSDSSLPPPPGLPVALTVEQVLPCESWCAVGGVHDLHAPLVRVANDDLQEAALRGDLGLVRRLIHAGASVNAPMRPECDDEFMSLLHVLAMKPEMPNGSRIVAEIVANQANLNVRSSLGTTPLMCGCLSKHVGAVEVLLEARADPLPMDDHSRTAGTCAVIFEAVQERMPLSEQEETLSVEILQLLAQAGADMDGGGDEVSESAPLLHAVRSGSERLVATLLAAGAAPRGFHEAVATSPLSTVKALVAAQADPFLRDALGHSAMDVAIARGNEEITTLLRNFVGDLQRQQHPNHLKALWEERQHEGAAGGRLAERTRSRNDFARCSSHRSKSFPDCGKEVAASGSLKGRVQTLCRRINRSRYFQLVMFGCLLAALFLPDLWILLDIASSGALDVLLFLIISTFSFEILVQAIGLSKSYAWKFFFWVDLVGIVSVLLDHSMVTDALPRGFENPVVMRTARMAKLGARAARFSKLVKLLRFLPGFQDQGGSGTAKTMSQRLNTALSAGISCLIIVLVLLLPVFELLTYPGADSSMQMWVQQLAEAAWHSPEAAALVLVDLQEFYGPDGYGPFRAYYTLANGSAVERALPLRAAPTRAASEVRITSAGTAGDASLAFDFTSPQQLEALSNCLLIATTALLMLGAGLLITNSVSSIILVPLELLLDNVQKVASKIFMSVVSISSKAGREEEELAEEGLEDEGGFGNETLILERVLAKLAALGEITVKKTPLDTDTFHRLDEEYRMILQGYSAVPSEETQSQRRGSLPPSALAELEQERHWAALQEAVEGLDVLWADVESWDFSVLDLDPPRRLDLCCHIVQYHGAAAMSEVQAKSQAVQVHAACSSFVESAARGYSDPKVVPYHNFIHAADTTFTLFRLLRACGAEHYLDASERFALILAALCHDIGHTGLNNHFIIETAHELAIRYNDHSPLESMHCAHLFHLEREPGCEVFACFSPQQRAELRRIIIEAVLHTDYQRHFALVKETQSLHERHADLLDAFDGRTAFPSPEIAVLFQTSDCKAYLLRVLVHFCDVSNPMKAARMCKAWASMILDEFFLQGDRERALGLPVQPLNERRLVNKPYAQVAFIEYFVAPLAFEMARLVQPLGCLADKLLENIEMWFACWVEETRPTPSPEERARVQERVGRLLAKRPPRPMLRSSEPCPPT